MNPGSITDGILDTPMLDREDTIARDLNFQDAMHAAILAGKEDPPMIGIDRRPCTKHPRQLFAPDSTKRHGSSLSDVGEA